MSETNSIPIISKTTPDQSNTLSSVDHIQTIFDPSTCIQRGLCTVSTSLTRSPKPHNIYYELHGSTSPTSTKIVFIMGLNNSSFAWERQVKYFSTQGDYSVLVFDNRGVGNSDVPLGGISGYKISEMAQDTVELLDFIGWTKEREVNVVGVSMGGMISLELAKLIPNRILTLNLTSTKARNKGFELSFKKINMFGRLLTGTVSVEQAIKLTVDILFPTTYLDVVDPDDPAGRTRRVTVEEDFVRRNKVGKTQTGAGKWGQMMAVMSHNVTPTQLADIAKNIPKIVIITGDQDELIDHHNSKILHDELPGSELKIVPNAGHALCSQIAIEYNEFIRDTILEAQKAQKSLSG